MPSAAGGRARGQASPIIGGFEGTVRNSIQGA